MKICPDCDSPNSDETRFCRACGARLPSAVAAVEQTAFDAPVPTENNAEAEKGADTSVSANVSAGANAKKISPVPWGVIAVVSVATIGGLAWSLGRKSAPIPLTEATPTTQMDTPPSPLPAEAVASEPMASENSEREESPSQENAEPTEVDPAEAEPTPQQQAAASEQEWETYSSPELGFRLDYPRGWTVSTRGGDEERVRFDAPDSDVSILVDVAPSSGESPLQGWRDMDKRFKRVYGAKYRLLSLEEKALDGQAGARWMFIVQKPGEARLKKIDWGVDYRGRGYALLFTAPAESFDQWYPTFSEALTRFHFEDVQ